MNNDVKMSQNHLFSLIINSRCKIFSVSLVAGVLMTGGCAHVGTNKQPLQNGGFVYVHHSYFERYGEDKTVEMGFVIYRCKSRQKVQEALKGASLELYSTYQDDANESVEKEYAFDINQHSFLCCVLINNHVKTMFAPLDDPMTKYRCPNSAIISAIWETDTKSRFPMFLNKNRIDPLDLTHGDVITTYTPAGPVRARRWGIRSSVMVFLHKNEIARAVTDGLKMTVRLVDGKEKEVLVSPSLFKELNRLIYKDMNL